MSSTTNLLVDAPADEAEAKRVAEVRAYARAIAAEAPPLTPSQRAVLLPILSRSLARAS